METKVRTYNVLRYAVNQSVRHSFILAGCYVAFFTAAHFMGFAELLWVRFVNYVMAFIVSYHAIKRVFIENNNHIEYFTGLLIGIIITCLAQFWFAVLFFIYLHLDKAFMNYLLTQIAFNPVSPEFTIVVVFFLEGVGLSPVVALALMQVFKSKRGRWAFEAK